MLGGSGQGEQIAANKVAGIRAALCNDLYTARLSREHNDANVLSMGGRIVAFGLADEILTLWLDTAFEGGRHQRRLDQISEATASRTRDALSTMAQPSNTMATQTTPMWRSLAETDPEIAAAIRDERHRQNSGLELIASENFVSRAVLEAAGSVLTNKYAEGYPGKRYYGGCEFVDVVERAAIARAKALFGADHANVQPHSGAQANMAVYLTLLQAGRHGARHEPRARRPPDPRPPAEFLGQALHDRPVRRAQGRRADRLRRARPPRRRAQAEDDHRRRQRLPARHRLRAASARAADRVGAAVFTDMAHIAGLVAAGVHPSPVPHSDFVTTTTHKTLRGPRGGLVLCREQYAKDLDRTRLPGRAGRTADAHHRRQGGVLQGGGGAGVRRLSAADRRERRAARRARSSRRDSAWSAAAPTTT